MNDGDQNPTEDPRRLAELSALADGTLDPDREAEVRAWIDASDDLRRRFEREQQVVALLRRAREHDRAPLALREQIASSRRRTARRSALRSARRSRAGGRSPVRSGVAVALAAGIAIVLALTLPGGTPGSPSVARAAGLGALGPTLPAPARPPAGATRLPVAVGRLHFPNWGATIGWPAVGQRRDHLGGRTVLTVYYAKAGRTVAYSIVSGSPLPQPPGTSTSSATYFFQSFRLHGRNVITWREAGHTCLLSAAGLPQSILAALVAHA